MELHIPKHVRVTPVQEDCQGPGLKELLIQELTLIWIFDPLEQPGPLISQSAFEIHISFKSSLS